MSELALLALAYWAGGFVMMDQATRASLAGDNGVPFQASMWLATIFILGGCLLTGLATAAAL